MKKSVAAVITGAFAVAVAGFGIQPAAAFDGNPLMNDHDFSDNCATPYGGQKANGTFVTLWTCNGSDSQAWKWKDTPQGSEIVNSASGRCLTPQGGHSDIDGTQLTLWDCGTSPSQYFTSPYDYETFTLHGGECITNYAGSWENGTNLTLWTCNASDAQNWVLSRS